MEETYSRCSCITREKRWLTFSQQSGDEAVPDVFWLFFLKQSETQLKLVVSVNEWVALMSNVLYNAPEWWRYGEISKFVWCMYDISFPKHIVPELRSKKKIQASSSAPVSLCHYQLENVTLRFWRLESNTWEDDLLCFPRIWYDYRIRLLRWYWLGGQTWLWPVTLHMDVLAHCGPYEVIREVNGKQRLSQRSRAETHAHYVCNSIQTHTGICEKKHTYLHQNTEDNQTHSF